MAPMIKFRVWSKEEECWVSIDSIVLDSNGSIAYLLPEADDQPPYLEEEVEIMQYIGLKDANGKEIYEGDIIKFFGGNKKNKAKNEFGVIVYKADRYGAGFNSIIQNKEHGYGGINIAQDIVVGNVHTNHELLEEE